MSVRRTVLIADDSDSGRELLRAMLGVFDCEVVEAPNGALAVEMAIASMPDVVILDVRMPVVDGYQAMQQLRQDARFSRTAIIALTAHAMDGDRERGLAAGFSEYLTKPIGPRKLRDVLARYLSEGSRQDG